MKLKKNPHKPKQTKNPTKKKTEIENFLDRLPYIGFLQDTPAYSLSELLQLLQQHCSTCSHIDITGEIFIPTQDVCCAEYAKFCFTKAHYCSSFLIFIQRCIVCGIAYC